jgi:hypothetical protein
MGVRISVASGMEKYLPFARKKLKQLKKRMAKRGRKAAVRHVPLPDNQMIKLNVSPGSDRIRLTGGMPTIMDVFVLAASTSQEYQGVYDVFTEAAQLNNSTLKIKSGTKVPKLVHGDTLVYNVVYLASPGLQSVPLSFNPAKLAAFAAAGGIIISTRTYQDTLMDELFVAIGNGNKYTTQVTNDEVPLDGEWLAPSRFTNYAFQGWQNGFRGLTLEANRPIYYTDYVTDTEVSNHLFYLPRAKHIDPGIMWQTTEDNYLGWWDYNVSAGDMYRTFIMQPGTYEWMDDNNGRDKRRLWGLPVIIADEFLNLVLCSDVSWVSRSQNANLLSHLFSGFLGDSPGFFNWDRQGQLYFKIHLDHQGGDQYIIRIGKGNYHSNSFPECISPLFYSRSLAHRKEEARKYYKSWLYKWLYNRTPNSTDTPGGEPYTPQPSAPPPEATPPPEIVSVTGGVIDEDSSGITYVGEIIDHPHYNKVGTWSWRGAPSGRITRTYKYVLVMRGWRLVNGVLIETEEEFVWEEVGYLLRNCSNEAFSYVACDRIDFGYWLESEPTVNNNLAITFTDMEGSGHCGPWMYGYESLFCTYIPSSYAPDRYITTTYREVTTLNEAWVAFQSQYPADDNQAEIDAYWSQYE